MAPSIFCNYLLTSLLSIATRSSLHDVESISIFTNSYDDAGTDAIVHAILWFNYSIYKYTLNNASISIIENTDYTAHKNDPNFEVIGSSSCEPDIDGSSDTKLLIACDNDPIHIEKVKFTTSSGFWYGIDAICTEKSPSWKHNPEFNYLLGGRENKCSGEYESYEAYEAFCVGGNMNNYCFPSKQIVYFDTSETNKYINNALWMNGSNIFPEIVTCHPTNIPTSDPTNMQTVSNLTVMNNVVNATITDNEYDTTEDASISTTFSLLPTNKTTLGTFLRTNDSVYTYILETDSIEYRGPTILLPIITIFIPIILFCICVLIIIWVLYHRKRQQSDSNTATIMKDKKESIEVVMAWIEHTLELPQYIDMFILHGYTSMDRIQQIDDKLQLEEIGVCMKGHQTLIMSEIIRLRENAINEMVAIQSRSRTSLRDSDSNEMQYNDALMDWCKHILELPEYIDNFNRSGYCNMHLVQKIKSKAQLDKIGIIKKGHQILIMDEIYKLQDAHEKRIKIKNASVPPKKENILYDIIAAEVLSDRERNEAPLKIIEDSSSSDDEEDSLQAVTNTTKNAAYDSGAMQTARDAMRNDKIALRIIKTNK